MIKSAFYFQGLLVSFSEALMRITNQRSPMCSLLSTGRDGGVEGRSLELIHLKKKEKKSSQGTEKGHNPSLAIFLIMRMCFTWSKARIKTTELNITSFPIFKTLLTIITQKAGKIVCS